MNGSQGWQSVEKNLCHIQLVKKKPFQELIVSSSKVCFTSLMTREVKRSIYLIINSNVGGVPSMSELLLSVSSRPMWGIEFFEAQRGGEKYQLPNHKSLNVEYCYWWRM